MRYAEHAPPDSLAHLLHCLWTFEDDAPGGDPQRIVPDGRCELIVHLGEPCREARSPAPQPRALFAGQLTRPLWVEATGPCRVVAARFRPPAARAFAGGSMRRTTDRRLALEELAPGHALHLAESLGRLTTAGERVEALGRWIGVRVVELASSQDLAVVTAADRIEATRGRVEIEELLAGTGLGRRQFERRFGDQVGVGPALLATIFRFRRVFDVLEHGGPRPWTDAALEAGYYDQSHFIRDFRRFVGCTPSEFIGSGAGLATSLV